MWNAKQVLKELIKFDTSTPGGFAIFSDWLEDQEQFEWAIINRYLHSLSYEGTENLLSLVGNPEWRSSWPLTELQEWAAKHKQWTAVGEGYVGGK